MKISEFIEVADSKVSQFKTHNPDYSPWKVTNLIHDNVGFIDIAMEGGGVKGITIAGAIYAMEQLNLRFRKVAGTSAGAIAASLIVAAGKNALDEKAEKLLEILITMDFFSFVDGGKDAKALLESPVKSNTWFGNFWKKTQRIFSVIRNIDDIVSDLGINPGNEFKAVITTELKNLSGNPFPFTVGVLDEKFNQIGLQLGNDFKGELAIVATDISNIRKAVFPRDLERYFYNWAEVYIGDLVRASMSIPIFFEPFKLSDFRGEEANLKDKQYITFVDGGLISNFPLSIFDTSLNFKPKCPTFGLLIDEDEKPEPKKVENILELGMSMFETTREYGDKAYIEENQHAQARVIRMSNKVGNKSINTTDFNLNDEDKKVLFQNGVNAALGFLAEWDFAKYIRKYRS